MSADRTISIGSIGGWLASGWRSYAENAVVSSTYIALFLIPGAIMQYLMMAEGYGLVYYLFSAGFIILIPALSALYYPLSRVTADNSKSGASAILSGLASIPKACWVLTGLMVALYLIWITDALIIYSFYFRLDPVLIGDYLGDVLFRSEVNSFILNISLAGMVIAFIAYAITVFSLPHAFDSGAGFVDAIVFSVKSIISHFRVMLAWALVLSITQLAALMLFSPVEIILLPVLAYANLAAYREIREASRDE